MSEQRAPVSDGAMLAAIGCMVGVGALLWLWGGLAGVLFGHGWPPVGRRTAAKRPDQASRTALGPGDGVAGARAALAARAAGVLRGSARARRGGHGGGVARKPGDRDSTAGLPRREVGRRCRPAGC